MNKVISHITRTLTIYLLMAGFMVHLLAPFSSSAQKIAFTQWLDHNVVATGNESEIKLRNSIRELPEQSGDFWVLIQQASELVKNHKDDFSIHLSYSEGENEEKQRLSSWLVSQWSVFQNHHDTNNAVLPEVKTTIHKWLTIHSNAFGNFTNPSVKFSDLWHPGIMVKHHDYTPYALTPLKSGISINAP